MTVIAVAGGAGKLGRAIVEALVEQGQHTVVALAREVIIIVMHYLATNYLTQILGQRCTRSPGYHRGLHRRR
jgi:NAD(P)-dependent dehydrogenase (short-subunit alcohol dehydrogenase family)